MKDMRKGEMRHVVPGTNPNEHIRTDPQIRAENKKWKPFAGCVLRPSLYRFFFHKS